MTPLPPHDWHAPIIAGIVAAYGRARNPVYVEIGVDRGQTLKAVAPHASVAFGVDVTFEHMDPVLKGWPNVILCESSSDEFFTDYDGPRPDVVFIDGDHSDHQVNMDVISALTLMANDGMIVVHDTQPQRQEWADSHCGTGWKAIEDWSTADGLTFGNQKLQFFTVPLFPGLTFMGYRPTFQPA